MAQGHGGYRKPANPAPVSGPGSLSRRTDGQPKMDLPNAHYGEAKSFNEIQSGAPMASAGSAPQGGAAGPSIPLTPLGAASERPDEPITAGAPVGPGVGPAALGLPSGSARSQDIEHLRPMLPALESMANMPGASPSLRQYVRDLKASL